MHYPAYRLVDLAGDEQENGPVDISLALRDLFGKSTQSEIAARLRARGLVVDQTKVSRWLRGTLPDLADLAVMEAEFGQRKGWVLARAGVVDLPDVESLSQPVEAVAPQWLVARLDALDGELRALRNEVRAATAGVIAVLEGRASELPEPEALPVVQAARP